MQFRRLRIVLSAWLLVAIVFGQALILGSGIPGAKAAPTFYLPWEAGSVWQITNGNGTGEHANTANQYAFDAVPVSGRSSTRVTAIAAGTVLGFQNDVPDDALFYSPHAGNCMMIRHEDGTVSIYAHLAAGSIPAELLQEGAPVRGGMAIGTVGNTGYSTGVHLHWSLLSEGHMYEGEGFRTCAGTSIPSRYADNDQELIEDGGVPRTGRYYASTNTDGGSTPSQPVADAPTDPTNDQPALTYFALGDSYASGHGLPGYDGDPCRRSPSSYPYRVEGALSSAYGTIKFQQLACSGATAAKNGDDTSSPFKSLQDQADIANAYLNARDGRTDPEPVLITITIGANDLGLRDWDTWGQISRQWPPSSGTGFLKWLDDKSRPVASSLTPIIDTFLSHENVHIILTDYPNPFREDEVESKLGNFLCNDMFLSMSCDEALAFTLAKLNSIMLDQFLQVNDPGHLRVAALGSVFFGHYSNCLSPNSQTWFGDDCVHPNELGAQAIADTIMSLVPTMIAGSPTTVAAASSTAAPVSSTSETITLTIASTGCDSSGACRNEIGAQFTVTTVDGTYLGSCTLEGQGDEPYLVACGVEVPDGIVVVVTEDVSTIRPGLVPEINPIIWNTADKPTPPNVPSFWGPIFKNSPTTVSNAAPAPRDEIVHVSITMTFRGCPEGFDPAADDFASSCTIPLDAPDAATIVWGGDGQGGMNITGLDRQTNGAYVYDGDSSGGTILLQGLAPVVRNAYQVIGADSVAGDTYTIQFSGGETREVFIYYWYQ